MMKQKKDKRVFIKMSQQMFDDFDNAVSEKEYTKSEVLRECIRKFIKDSKSK